MSYQEQSTTHVARERIKEVREETENIILSSHGEERDCSMTDPFSIKELKDALKKTKTKKAPGPDGITGEMLKHLGACSRAVLLKIFNHSWIKGVVPAVWKQAIVIPVPKKGKDKKNPRSYSPISLLSCVGKLLERMINRRLINHLESNNVLSPTQTGYRKHRSTEDQLAYLAQNIEDAFQEKRKVLAVFFDLSNAFDKVWKEGLLVKLLRTGVRSKMYMWIQHFLFARTGRVKLDGILSKKKSVFVKEYHRTVFCPPHCSWSTSMISSSLYQRGSQTHYMQTTWQSGMRLSTPPLQPTGSKKPSVISASGHWTGASR